MSLAARLTLVCAAAFIPLALAAQTPRIFTHTKASLPGDMLVLHGADFVVGSELPEVWLDRVTGGADTPDPETRATEIVSFDDKLIHVRIPASLQAGLYALFVKRGASTSSPVWINRADVWQTLDIGGTQIDPGRPFRLCGWNLDLPGATSQVWFENTATLARTAAVVTDQTRANLLVLTAPASISPGQSYRLIVSNGHGGAHGETAGPTLDCVPVPVDALGLGVPWADEFAFAAANVYNVKTDPRLALHAVGDGVADDRAAIQAACDAATAAGGGSVYLPAGTYNLGATSLRPRQRVVLRGAGRDLTTLVGAIEPHYVHSTLGTTFHNGVLDLTLTGGRLRLHSFQPDGGPVVVARSRIDHAAGTGLDVRGIRTHLLVRDNEIITRSTTGKGVFEANNSVNMLFANNYVQWSEGRIEAGNGRNFQIDGNEFARTVATANNGLGYGGWEVSRCSDIAILDNVFSKLGSGPIPQYNDGETILNQGVPRFGAGHPTAVTATTLTDTARSWTTGQLLDAQAWVAIVSGPGEGQWRRIAGHTADTLTLDTPWDILPTAASGYTVTWRDRHWLIAGNVFQDCPRPLWLYSCSMTDAAIVDNQFVNCADIYLRADQRLGDAAGGRFTVFRNVLLQNNDVLNTSHVYPSQFAFQSVVAISDETSLGNPFWDVVARANSMDSLRPGLTASNNYGVAGEGYFAIATGPGATDGTQAVKGVVFDRNYALDLDTAFRTSTGAVRTTIWKPVADNVGALHLDTVRPGAAAGAIDTVVVPESRLYLNTWSPRGNISTDLDPIDPALFFDWTEFGTGSIATDAFGGADANTGSAQASGPLIRFTIPAGYNYSVGNGTGADNFKDVLPLINSLPPGTYTLRLSFDYASNHTDARRFELLLYSANGNKDSGGNDRWETAKQSLASTDDLNAFARRTADYTFTLVDASAPSPRPEGTFEAGKFAGFRFTIGGDARQAGDPTLILRLDNLALDLL